MNQRLFRIRNRTAKRLSRRIDSLSQTRRSAGRISRQQAYQKLIQVAQASVKQAKNAQVILLRSNPRISHKPLRTGQFSWLSIRFSLF